MLTGWSGAEWVQRGTWMKEKVAAPVETFPESWEVSAAVCASRAAPNWKASPPLVPCSPEVHHLSVIAQGAPGGHHRQALMTM